MKVYKITIQRANNDILARIAVAPTIEKAIEYTRRYYKKTFYYNTCNIIQIEVLNNVDIFYKS